MARILAISSYVAHGHVGLAAITPALQAMGHEVIAVPTIVLSSHFGYSEVGGFRPEPGEIANLIDALAANRILQSVDAVLTGYLPSLEIVEGLARMLDRLGSQHPDVLYLCDPVMGDDPDGLYVSEEVAAAIRDSLVPLADILTPNRFELAWLTGEEVATADDADAAADAIGAELVAVTSVPAGEDHIANVMSGIEDALAFATRHRGAVPHGTGDLFAALLLGHVLNGAPHAEAVARASAGIAHMVEASIGQPELALVANIAATVTAAPLNGQPIA